MQLLVRAVSISKWKCCKCYSRFHFYQRWYYFEYISKEGSNHRHRMDIHFLIGRSSKMVQKTIRVERPGAVGQFENKGGGNRHSISPHAFGSFVSFVSSFEVRPIQVSKRNFDVRFQNKKGIRKRDSATRPAVPVRTIPT